MNDNQAEVANSLAAQAWSAFKGGLSATSMEGAIHAALIKAEVQGQNHTSERLRGLLREMLAAHKNGAKCEAWADLLRRIEEELSHE